MSSFFLFVICCAVVGVLTRLFRKFQGNSSLPPGPSRLPIIGNIHQLGGHAPATFSKWAKQYGKLYTIYFGGSPALVVSDVHLMKQVFGTMASTGKFQNIWFDLLMERDVGIFNSEGKEWWEQRQFLTKVMREFGFGSKRSYHVESMIISEATQLCSRLEREMEVEGKVYLSETLKESSGATLWALVTGQKITPRVVHLLEEIVRVSQVMVKSGLMFLPGLRYIAPEWSGYNAGVKVSQEMKQVVEDSFLRHCRAQGGSDHDVMSAYVQQLENMKDTPGSVFYGAVGANHSTKSVLALLVAGIESSASVLNWLIFYMAAHPDIQRKLQAEIDENVGPERDPSLEDKIRLPFTEAVILETLRMSSTVPFGMIHKLLEDVTVEGYRLPEGMYLIANIYHSHNDPDVWGDPEIFRPERFLDLETDTPSSGVTLRRPVVGSMKDYVTSFQPGRRSCVGEPVARDVMFLFVAKLFQTFTFCPEENRSKEDYMEQNMGLMIIPKHIGVRALPRKEIIRNHP